MRLRIFLLITIAGGTVLGAPAVASADFAHVVSPGESLSSIAAADGLSVAQLAAANGISPSAQLTTGSTVQIPPQGSSAAAGPASTATGVSTSSSTGSAVDPDNDGDVDNGASGATESTAAPASTSQGVYVVQPGDTLSAIAAREGVSVAQLAAANGLDPNQYLVSGTVLRPAGSGGSGPVFVSSQTTSSSSVANAQPVGAAAQGIPTDPPYPTPERVTAPEVDAIAWQESGFNNDVVSSSDARGVMQILPGTWQYIQNDLNPAPPLAPASAADNVRGGVVLLHSLLTATGGDPSLAAAGYYQGLPSVQQNGLYPSTQQYVNDVLSLERQFGGG